MIAQIKAFSPSSKLPHRLAHQRKIIPERSLFPLSTVEDLPSSSSPFGSTSILTAFEVFDGKDIVEPVVVSNVFWVSLQEKLTYFVAGQLLAVAVFVVLATVAGQQLSQLGDFLDDKIFSQEPSSSTKDWKIPPKRTTALESSDFTRLFVSIAIDIVGSLVPKLGTIADVTWAPIAGILLRSVYNGSTILFLLEFSEEVLPFTNVLPLATLCWVVDIYFAESDLAQLLRLGQFRRLSL